MIDYPSLLRETEAFRSLLRDKTRGTVSHAYLVVTPDSKIAEYLKFFAKLIACKSAEPCNACRSCRLIDGNIHPDVIFFPKNGDVLLKEDLEEIISETYLKPVESEEKIFVIGRGESMPPISQNKLLKTLEEPPIGVRILIGAESEHPLLPTVRSRVKKLVIPPFDENTLKNALKGDCPNAERLASAVACGNGTVGRALELYGDEGLAQTIELAEEVFREMKTSRDVLKYSVKINALKDGVKGFISVYSLAFRDMLLYYNGKEELAFNKPLLNRIKGAEGFSLGATVYARDRIAEAERRLLTNANPQAVAEWLLFAVLEGKHKWQK